MDDANHHRDPDYDASYGVPTLPPSSNLARLTTTPANSHHGPDPSFSYGMHNFGTLLPSSLSAFHTSHDDSCVDTCIPKDYSLLPPHRGSYTPSHAHRPCLSTSSITRSHFPLENDAYTTPVPEPPDFFSQYFFDVKFPLGNDPKPTNYFPLAGNQVGGLFDNAPGLAPGLSMAQQCPAPDDCVSVDCSQVSCSSNCCSTVCQDNSCTEGTPCNDVSCFDSNLHQPFGDMFNEFPEWHHSMTPQLADDPHNQPCNHTNTEHDVAFTLRDLKAPNSSALQHHQDPFQFECPFLSTSEQSAADTDHRVFPLGHGIPDLTYDPTIAPYPNKPRSCARVTTEPTKATQHVCGWVVASPGDAEEICGQVFNDSSALNEHMSADHVSLLSAKTKYICQWHGCSRGDDQGFASRNKLKRHITTHTACT